MILTMKSGERYELPQPPRHRNGMVSFKTKDGRFLTVKQAEVAREETVVPVVVTKKADQTDTRQLGAVAREQRAERGIEADVAGPPSGEKKAAPEKREKAPAPPKKPAHRAKKHSSPPPPPPADSSDSR
jgi:hypothetical protein